MNICRDFDRLPKMVARLPYFRRGNVIGVEGFMGAGKTSLTSWLANELSVQFLSADEFVAIHGGCMSYPSRVSTKRLSQALASAIRQGRPVFLEGICLRAIAHHLIHKPAAYIYIKRMAGSFWHDGFHLEDFASVRSAEDDLHEPHLSDLHYHLRFSPHKKAALILERQEDVVRLANSAVEMHHMRRGA